MDNIEKGNRYNQIHYLKHKLSLSDYMVIKAAEYAVLSLECEYDLSALHAERQAIRDQINQLEQEIADLEVDEI